MTKKRFILLIAIALLLLLGAAIFFAPTSAPPATDKSQTRQPDSAATPAMTVTTEKPLAQSLSQTLVANGNIAAWQEASIGSQAHGLRLVDVLVNVGDKVSAGQLLARFSADTVQADLALSRASLVEAQATAQDASANAERARTLSASGALSTQQISQFQTAEQTAKARVEAARAQLDAQQLRLEFTQLLAPDDGVISARTATVGAVVASGTELFRMIRKGRLEWRAEVTATELGRLQQGINVTVTAANGTELTGRVRMIAPTVDPQTRAALVYVDLAAGAASHAPARAGMFATGEFELGKTTALTVSQQAVVVRDGFSYVFRVNPDSRVSQLKIVTGRRVQDRVEVVDGIQPETTLVVAGAGFLNDGDLVRVVPQSASAAQ